MAKLLRFLYWRRTRSAGLWSKYCRLSVALGAMSCSPYRSPGPSLGWYGNTTVTGVSACDLMDIEYPVLVPVDSSGEMGTDLWDGLLWAVPKKRTSHSKKRMRMTHKYLKPIRNYTVCPKCQNLKLLHVLCGHCLKETLKKTAELRRKTVEQRGLF